MKRPGTMRASGRRAMAAGMEFGIEQMESRQLMAADLAVAWDNANFHIPAVAVPGDRFDPNGGTNRIEAPIQVVNVGTTAASGTTRIDFYLSLNTSASISGQDILLRSYTGEPLSLDVYTGDPNQIGTFSPDMFIPAETAPGTYFLKVRLVPDTNVGDFNASNNIAASADGLVVDRKFGSFNGRTNVTMALKDAEGTIITFSATGGGYGTVTPSADGFGVTLFGAGNATDVALAAGGGDGKYDLTFVTINGSVATFSAPDGRLRGALTTTTGFGAMTFGDVLGPTTITVPATSQTPSFTFKTVQDVTIDSAVGIGSLSVGAWFDTGAVDSIRAPWLGSLNSTGNFYPNMQLTGRGGGQPTLGPVTISGVIKRGAWSVNGVGSTLSIFATTVYWSASYAGAVTSLTTGGSFRGMFTASSIGSITSGRDILLSGILAGAYLGADGVLGGTGQNADTFGAGTIGTIDVFHNIAGVTIGAGYDPVDGVLRNGNDVIQGGTTSSIGRITVGNIIGAVARIITNVYSGPITVNGVAQDWHNNPRYSLSTTAPEASLVSATVGDVGGAPTASISVRFASTGLIDRNTILDGVIRVTGPGGFLGFGVLVSKPFETGSNQRVGLGNFTVRLANVGAPATPGTYTITLVGNTVTDARGNFAPAGTLGTFDVM